LAIDDFGSGYSNMINILQLQPEYIKIDGSLVQELQNNPAYYSFVETIVSFAHKNGIKTVAEFVSSKEIFEVVQKLGIDFSQGYYFAKPEIKPQ
jgi:EAL domain-containing protein (putative c-di-GMP-specific phosphodiesterase class I)